MQVNGCTTSKNLKKELPKNYDDCREIKKEYNELLNDFNKLAAMESECYKLNQELTSAAKVNDDLIKKLNQQNKNAKTNQVIAIVIISVLATSLIAGGVAVGVKLNK